MDKLKILHWIYIDSYIIMQCEKKTHFVSHLSLTLPNSFAKKEDRRCLPDYLAIAVMDPWRAHRIRRAEKVLADRYMAYIRDEFLKEEEIDENDFPLEFSWERVCNRMLKMISITRKTMEEHKLHLDSFIGTWDEFGRPGGRGLVVFTVQEACLWVDESLEPYLAYFTYS